MTEQKVVEILENHSYNIELMPKTSTILAVKNGCAAIVAVESGKTESGWIHQVGKYQFSDINEAIKHSVCGVG